MLNHEVQKIIDREKLIFDFSGMFLTTVGWFAGSSAVFQVQYSLTQTNSSIEDWVVTLFVFSIFAVLFSIGLLMIYKLTLVTIETSRLFMTQSKSLPRAIAWFVAGVVGIAPAAVGTGVALVLMAGFADRCTG